MDGLFNSIASPELEYQCPPPNLSYFDYEMVDVSAGLHHLAEMLDLKRFSTPEDAVRGQSFGPKRNDAVTLTLDYVRNIIEEEGPFHGVIGASEGAGAAATVLINELETSYKNGCRPEMQCGIFFVGVPALKVAGKGWILCDETDQRITVPTCHVYSENDPLVMGSKALRDICQPNGRTLILHEYGHTIPHEKWLMADVGKFVRGLSQGAA